MHDIFLFVIIINSRKFFGDHSKDMYTLSLRLQLDENIWCCRVNYIILIALIIISHSNVILLHYFLDTKPQFLRKPHAKNFPWRLQARESHGTSQFSPAEMRVWWDSNDHWDHYLQLIFSNNFVISANQRGQPHLRHGDCIRDGEYRFYHY